MGWWPTEVYFDWSVSRQKIDDSKFSDPCNMQHQNTTCTQLSTPHHTRTNTPLRWISSLSDEQLCSQRSMIPWVQRYRPDLSLLWKILKLVLRSCFILCVCSRTRTFSEEKKKGARKNAQHGEVWVDRQRKLSFVCVCMRACVRALAVIFACACAPSPKSNPMSWIFWFVIILNVHHVHDVDQNTLHQYPKPIISWTASSTNTLLSYLKVSPEACM